MTKTELIKLLNTIEGDPVIMLSSDSEGNSYSPVYDYDIGWSPDKKYREYYNEMSVAGVEDEYEYENPVFVLYPSH